METSLQSCQDCSPEFFCRCESGSWQCAQLAFACLGPCAPAINGQTCAAGSVVEEGTFECCGSVLPQWVCRCNNAGTYECTLENPPNVVCVCAEPIVLAEAANVTIVP